MRNSLKYINRNSVIILAVIMLTIFWPNLNGISMVWANEKNIGDIFDLVNENANCNSCNIDCIYESEQNILVVVDTCDNGENEHTNNEEIQNELIDENTSIKDNTSSENDITENLVDDNENSKNVEVKVNNLDNEVIYAGQEKSFEYEIKGGNLTLSKDNIKIYKVNGELADEANIKVKEVTAGNIILSAAAVDPTTDKASYYVDIVDANGKSVAAQGEKYKINVDVLESKFNVKNIEYIRSDEDNIYFKITGISTEVESLYTSFVVSANAIVAEGETLSELYKSESVVEGKFKNNAVIKIPVKADSDDSRDDKSTSQDYRFTFSLKQNKTDESGVYKCESVTSDTSYSNQVIYYETNLKVKALPISKNIYSGQRDIQIATPIFSQNTSNKTVVYLEDDKNQIVTNNYGGILGNAFDPDSGTLVINIPKYTTAGKHVLTFTAAAPKGCSPSQASLTVNVKIGIESLSMTTDITHYYLNNKDINIKPKTDFYNITLRPLYNETITPSTLKAVYSLESDNEELLKYITINRSNGNVKISKNLTPVFDSIKSKGDKFKIVAVANDFEGIDEPDGVYLEKDRRAVREFTLSTDGLSDRIEKANEIRCFIGESDIDKKRTELAITDKNSKTMTSFSINEAQQLEFKLYDSVDASDDEYIDDGFIWKVNGPVKRYRASSTLLLDAVSPGIVTITAIAADGSGRGSVTRKIEIKRDSCKLGLYDNVYSNVVTNEYENENYLFQAVEYFIIPFNDDETEPIYNSKYYEAVENGEWYDFTEVLDSMEHNYRIKISGGIIERYNNGVLDWLPTEQYTTITLINNNKGSNGKRVQEDKVYRIHNQCFDKTDPDFDKVKIPTVKVVANKYVEGKKAAKIKFEIKNLPKEKVVDIGEGHTGYYLTVFKNHTEKSRYPEPEFWDMTNAPAYAEIMIEDGKYYATLTQNIGGEEWWEVPSDFVAGTYKLEAYIKKGDYSYEDPGYTLNKKFINTTVIVTKNNLKAVWEGAKVTKVDVKANKTDEPVYLVRAGRQDTSSFKWGKNKYVESVKITGVKYDTDTANIYKENLLDDDKLIKFTTVSGNNCVAYTAEDFNEVKQAVIDAASGKTTSKNSSAQKAAAKMIKAKPDKNGNYDINKVNPVIKGYFIYTIEGTDEMGYHTITNLKQNFEITLSD